MGGGGGGGGGGGRVGVGGELLSKENECSPWKLDPFLEKALRAGNQTVNHRSYLP